MAMIQLGDIRLDLVWEMDDHSFDISSFFPLSTPHDIEAQRHWMEPGHYDSSTGRIALSMHSWLIRTPKTTILIDGCVGNDKVRPTRPLWDKLDLPFLSRLGQLSVTPEDVDYVMCTHLHADHVGWNTRLLDGRWVPTFPNARYLFSRKDFENSQAKLERLSGEPREHHLQSYVDSVLPVVEAGQALLVEDNFDLEGILTIEAAPGHTPGHVAIWLNSPNGCGVFTGDVIHHPIQIHHPGWSCMGCEDPVEATLTRIKILETCVDRSAFLFPGHFMAPHAGHVVDAGGGRLAFRWVNGDVT